MISPGCCQTDTGSSAARDFGMEQAPVTVENSCSQMVLLIDAATKRSDSGKFWQYNGNQLDW